VSQNITPEGFNWLNVAANIMLGIIAAYITLLVRSIRKESQLKIDSVKDVYGKQIEACTDKWRKADIHIDDLLIRARVLGTLEERLHAGAEQFKEIKKRLDDIEFILYKKGKL
jgi:hypothetical protein